MVITLSSTHFYSYSIKTTNHNTASNKYFLLIGQFWSMSAKIVLESFMTVSPNFLERKNIYSVLPDTAVIILRNSSYIHKIYTIYKNFNIINVQRTKGLKKKKYAFFLVWLKLALQKLNYWNSSNYMYI